MTITANFTAQPTAIYAGDTVQFTDTSVAVGETITSWTWDFGDGSDYDHTQNPSHIYNIPGIYPVTFTAGSSSSSNTIVKKAFITVLRKSTPSSDPRVTLLISDDGGITWKNPIYGSLGKIGQYITRARFQRLGYARDRVFKIVITEAVQVQMIMAMLDFEVGNS